MPAPEPTNCLFLNIEGTGIAYITGFEPTPGTWTITQTGTGPVFTFGSSMVIPEPSSATLLVCLGSLVWFVRRRIA
ncbi:MAG TPA: PEP-CTERM sorting domain-containing protein [Verrucomicrobia bacterium]|nr:PEP-CTERM sorting domain-containing protein [Verrucomicrobiota bacterium]